MQSFCGANTRFDSLAEARWSLFCRSLDACKMLPPISSAHQEHIRRANYAAAIWKNSHKVSQTLPNIEGFGWQKDYEAGAYIAKAG